MTNLIQIKPCPQRRGLWLLSAAILPCAMLPCLAYADRAQNATTVLEDTTPVTMVESASVSERNNGSDHPLASDQAPDDLSDLMDLSFPDLEASLPPLELLEPAPVESAVTSEVTLPKKNLFQRVRQWFRGDGSEGFAVEPVIEVAVEFVTTLPQVVVDAPAQWSDLPSPMVDQVALPVLPQLSDEQREAALTLLERNLSAALARVTLDEFADFNDSLPRLRSLAREAAQAVGFYESQFFFRKLAADHLHVDVMAGEPVRVASQEVRVDGQAQEQRRFQRIESQPDLAIGDILNHAKYEQTKNRIASAALERGYFDGRWQAHDVQVTLPDQTAEIRLVYQSGERYRFGDITFGTTVEGVPLPVRPELLAALLPFKSGDRYDARDIQTLSRQLLDVRWFNNIEVTAYTPDTIKNQQASPSTPLSTVSASAESVVAVPTQEVPVSNPVSGQIEADAALMRATQAKTVPVRVLVDARQPNSAEAGIGYGTDTGIRLRSQYRRALVNDRGHSLDANLELSEIRQAVDARYSLPYKHPLRDTLSVFGGFETEQVEQLDAGFNIQSMGGTLGVERSIRPSPEDWHRTLSLRYRLDQVEARFNDIDQARLIDPSTSNNTVRLTQQVLLAGYALNKVTRLGGVDPYRGRRQIYQIEVGSQALLSDVDLAILRAGWRAIESFTESRKHQLVGRVDLATILTDDFEAVPYNLRFFAGGDQSIRGYDYKSLSTVRDGELSGGQNLAVASLEYNYRFLPSWRGAVFVDAGNAFDEKFSDDVKVGAGIGVRWSSPIGPIRIDVAAGVSESSVPIRLHFFIGPSL